MSLEMGFPNKGEVEMESQIHMSIECWLRKKLFKSECMTNYVIRAVRMRSTYVNLPLGYYVADLFDVYLLPCSNIDVQYRCPVSIDRPGPAKKKP